MEKIIIMFDIEREAYRHREKENERKGANELSGWSQDNRNYRFPCFSRFFFYILSPPKRDSVDFSERKKICNYHTFIRLLNE